MGRRRSDAAAAALRQRARLCGSLPLSFRMGTCGVAGVDGEGVYRSRAPRTAAGGGSLRPSSPMAGARPRAPGGALAPGSEWTLGVPECATCVPVFRCGCGGVYPHPFIPDLILDRIASLSLDPASNSKTATHAHHSSPSIDPVPVPACPASCHQGPLPLIIPYVIPSHHSLSPFPPPDVGSCCFGAIRAVLRCEQPPHPGSDGCSQSVRLAFAFALCFLAAYGRIYFFAHHAIDVLVGLGIGIGMAGSLGALADPEAFPALLAWTALMPVAIAAFFIPKLRSVWVAAVLIGFGLLNARAVCIVIPLLLLGLLTLLAAIVREQVGLARRTRSSWDELGVIGWAGMKQDELGCDGV